MSESFEEDRRNTLRRDQRAAVPSEPERRVRLPLAGSCLPVFGAYRAEATRRNAVFHRVKSIRATNISMINHRARGVNVTCGRPRPIREK